MIYLDVYLDISLFSFFVWKFNSTYVHYLPLFIYFHRIFIFSSFFLIDKANDCRKNEAEDVKIKQNNPFANVGKTKSIQFICDCTGINENVFVHG